MLNIFIIKNPNNNSLKVRTDGTHIFAKNSYICYQLMGTL